MPHIPLDIAEQRYREHSNNQQRMPTDIALTLLALHALAHKVSHGELDGFELRWSRGSGPELIEQPAQIPMVSMTLKVEE